MANTDATFRTNDVDARLARLEAELSAARRDARRARRTSGALLAAAAVASVGGLMAASQVARVEDVLRVKRLEVVGEGDKVVLLAQASETGGQLDLWSKGGTNTVRLACAADGGDVVSAWDLDTGARIPIRAQINLYARSRKVAAPSDILEVFPRSRWRFGARIVVAVTRQLISVDGKAFSPSAGFSSVLSHCCRVA